MHISQALLIYPSKGNVSKGPEIPKISFLEMDGYKVIPTNQSIVILKQLVVDGISMDNDSEQFRYNLIYLQAISESCPNLQKRKFSIEKRANFAS